MIINPVTLTIARHELDAIMFAAMLRLRALKGDTPARNNLQRAIDSVEDELVRIKREGETQ